MNKNQWFICGLWGVGFGLIACSISIPLTAVAGISILVFVFAVGFTSIRLW